MMMLCESGLSIHNLALQLSVTDNPVHSVLNECGVRMRDPHGPVRWRSRTESIVKRFAGQTDRSVGKLGRYGKDATIHPRSRFTSCGSSR